MSAIPSNELHDLMELLKHRKKTDDKVCEFYKSYLPDPKTRKFMDDGIQHRYEYHYNFVKKIRGYISTMTHNELDFIENTFKEVS